ncbi:MAG: hypothetical protein J6S85_03430 [Methanobrevibacter sp.]|nr:hypothetical protein [Methanobrevibacter sp.]
MPEIYSISFPDGQPIWISSVYISNPENDDLALNYTTTRNTSGSQRSVVVRVN